jgi:hypothetical protein
MNLEVGDRVRQITCGYFGTIINIFEYPGMREPYDKQYRIQWDTWSYVMGFSFRHELEHIEFGYDDFFDKVKERLGVQFFAKNSRTML